MAQKLPKVKLPKGLIKALGLKLGDHIELMVDEDGNELLLQSSEVSLRETFGVWSDMKEDGVTYVRRLRKEWRKHATS
jgi:bifunctional DNA-binding transcriptional regulator/antitoxin component of YhaV-PrlF toxin-antitoxin module